MEPFRWRYKLPALPGYELGGSFANQVYSGSNLSYPDSGLSASTAYYYKISATNANGSSALSNAVVGSTTSAGGAPATPTGLAVSGATASTLNVSWNASTGATSYQVYRDISSTGNFNTNVYNSSGTSFTDTSLAASTIYYYKVKATNSYGSSVLSAYASGATTSAGSPPATPTGLAVSGPTSSTLNVAWNSSSGATSYQVYRDTSSTGNFATNVYNSSGTSFTDNGLTASTTYYYKVKATNTYGSSVLSAYASGATTSGGSAPATPTGLAVSGPTSSTLNVAWNSSSGATSYQVYRDTSSTGNFTTNVYNSSGTSFTDNGLTASTTYYYKVKATNTYGSSVLSAYASGATTSGGSAPATPTGLAVPSANWTSSSLYIQWNASSGATSYQLYSDTSSTGNFSTLVYNGTGTSYTNSSLSAPQTYFYEVKATNSYGSSALSSSAYGTTIGTIWMNDGNGTAGWDIFFTNDSANKGTVMWQYISGSHLALSGYVLSDVQKLSGSSSAAYGVIFDYLNSSDFWLFAVNTAGQYEILQRYAGSWTTVKAWTTSSYVNAGTGVINELEVDYFYSSPNYYVVFYINSTTTNVYYVYSSSSTILTRARAT